MAMVVVAPLRFKLPATTILPLAPLVVEDKVKVFVEPPLNTRSLEKLSVLAPRLMTLLLAVATVPVTTPLPVRVWPPFKVQVPSWDTSNVAGLKTEIFGVLAIEPEEPNASTPLLMV